MQNIGRESVLSSGAYLKYSTYRIIFILETNGFNTPPRRGFLSLPAYGVEVASMPEWYVNPFIYERETGLQVDA